MRLSPPLAVTAGLVVLLAAAGCASSVPKVVATSTAPVVSEPLTSSLATAQGSWAIVEMGGPASQENNFWQLFVRPAGAQAWSLVTPPGVADNGGLVAAGAAGSLLVGFRPSQGLGFSPLATSTNVGKNWTPGVLGAALADVPDALAPGPTGPELALLRDGEIDESGPGAGGSWSKLTSVSSLAASAAGRECGLGGVDAVSFEKNGVQVVAGSCDRPGVAGVFTDTNGTWRLDGPSVPGGGQVRVLRLSGTTALLAAGSSVYAAWLSGSSWTMSAPLGGVAGLVASGFGANGSAWVLFGDGHGAVIGAPGGGWQQLPAAPKGTAALALGGTGTEALAVANTLLTIWRLDDGTWTKTQTIKVPIVFGSSG